MENEKPEAKTEEAAGELTSLIPQYKVILHNDDVTPMDFVIGILLSCFDMEWGKAREVMLEAHNTGSSVVAVMPLERAEFKVERAHEHARANNYPLRFTIEPS